MDQISTAAQATWASTTDFLHNHDPTDNVDREFEISPDVIFNTQE